MEITPRPELQCETVAWRLVGLLGGDQGSGLRARTARLASALVHYSPDAREAVDNRRRQLDAAVQGRSIIARREEHICFIRINASCELLFGKNKRHSINKMFLFFPNKITIMSLSRYFSKRSLIQGPLRLS